MSFSLNTLMSRFFIQRLTLFFFLSKIFFLKNSFDKIHFSKIHVQKICFFFFSKIFIIFFFKSKNQLIPKKPNSTSFFYAKKIFVLKTRNFNEIAYRIVLFELEWVVSLHLHRVVIELPTRCNTMCPDTNPSIYMIQYLRCVCVFI